MKYTCKQCGKEFEITESEAEFFRSKGLNLPKRCKECRNANKNSSSEKKTGNEKTSSMPAVGYSAPSYSGWIKKGAVFAALVVLLILIPKVYSALNGGNEPVTDVTVTSEQTSAYAVSSATKTSSNNEQVFSVTVDNSETYVVEYSTETTTEYTVSYRFRNKKLLNSHYQKHGSEVGASSAQEYQDMAAAVVTSSEALHKTEKEDGDDVYYIRSTGEFVIVSTDGYIRTYYIADYDYFNRQ